MYQETSSFSGTSFWKSNRCLDELNSGQFLGVALMSSVKLVLFLRSARNRESTTPGTPARFVEGMSAMCAHSLTHSVIRRAGVEFYALLIKQLGGVNSWLGPPEIAWFLAWQKKYLTNAISRAYINQRFDM